MHSAENHAQHALDAGATPTIHILIPCAGSGSRAGSGVPKQYRLIAGRPLITHTLQAFAPLLTTGELGVGSQCLLIVAPSSEAEAVHYLGTDPITNEADAQPPERAETQGWAQPKPTAPAWQIVDVGGATRSRSVRNGLCALRERGADDQDWVLVHDAARCLLRPEWVRKLIETCKTDSVGGLLAWPVADTLKSAANNSPTEAARCVGSIEREGKWLAQTPQMFRLGTLLQALENNAEAEKNGRGPACTDEASAIEAMGLSPRLVAASSQNHKITYPEDFMMAETQLHPKSPPAATLRIGQGWDVHRLVQGRPLILGGISIPYEKGLLGHSDADVLLHAITDALLGAAALGDIGRHFPDTDPAYHGADSRTLLRYAWRKVQDAGWRLVNLDASIIAQAPKLMPHMDSICASIAQCLEVDSQRINIKAKTAEKLGPVGEGLSIEAQAIVLLEGVNQIEAQTTDSIETSAKTGAIAGKK